MKPTELNAFLGNLVVSGFLAQTQPIRQRASNQNSQIIEVGNTRRLEGFGQDQENSLRHYSECFDRGFYSAILFDGSLVFIKYTLDRRGVIARHRFAYLPSIVDIDVGKGEGTGELPAPSEYVYTPRRAFLRFEFEPADVSDFHPASHLHFDVPQCRLPLSSRLGVIGFFFFLIDTFYPNFREALPDARVDRTDDSSPNDKRRFWIELPEIK